MTKPLRLDGPAVPRKLGAALQRSAHTLATTFTAMRVLEQAEAVTQEGRTLPAVGAALAAAADKLIHKRLDANGGSAAPSAEALPVGPPEGFEVSYFHPERTPSAYTVSDMPLSYGGGRCAELLRSGRAHGGDRLQRRGRQVG